MDGFGRETRPHAGHFGACRARVGEAAERVVRAKADHDRNMARVEDIYYALVEGRSPAAGRTTAATAGPGGPPGP